MQYAPTQLGATRRDATTPDPTRLDYDRPTVGPKQPRNRLIDNDMVSSASNDRQRNIHKEALTQLHNGYDTLMQRSVIPRRQPDVFFSYWLPVFVGDMLPLQEKQRD